MSLLRRFIREESGQDLVEYAFLTGLIALVAWVGVDAVGDALLTYYQTDIAGAAPLAGAP